MQDPILPLAKAALRAYSYSTFGGFFIPFHIEPLSSCNAAFLWSGAVDMYAIGQYGLMAKVPLPQ